MLLSHKLFLIIFDCGCFVTLNLSSCAPSCVQAEGREAGRQGGRVAAGTSITGNSLELLRVSVRDQHSSQSPLRPLVFGESTFIIIT